MKLVITTYQDLEAELARELERIGGKNIEILHRAVKCEGDINLMYKANLYLRTALRVLVPIHTFTAKNERQYYTGMQEINWWEYFTLNQSFAIHSVVNSNIFTHSRFMALKAKDAIVDQFRDKYGRRPNVSVYSPDLIINVHISEIDITVSLDSSGDSLHKRGYKVALVQAPLSEVLAAGLLLQTDFESFGSFHDPMCGSGTFISEALMIHSNIAPGYFRQEFAFMKWKDFKKEDWHKLKEESRAAIKPPTIRFSGADIDRRSMFAGRKNLTQLPYGDSVRFDRKDFLTAKNVLKPEFMIMNPPYDVRLKSEDIDAMYEQIGTRLKHDFQGTKTCIYSGNLDALKKIGLKTCKKVSLMNGPITSKLHCYELYEGSKKK